MINKSDVMRDGGKINGVMFRLATTCTSSQKIYIQIHKHTHINKHSHINIH